MSIKMYSADWCADCRRSKRLLDERGVAYTEIDLEAEPEHIDEVMRRNDGKRIIPTIVFPDDTHLAEPTNDELLAKLGDHGLV